MCPRICICLLLVVCVDIKCVCVIAYGVCSACSPAQLMKCKQPKPRAAVTWSIYALLLREEEGRDVAWCLSICVCVYVRALGDSLHCGVCVRLGGCADRGRLVNKSWSDSESVPQPWRPVWLQLCQRKKEKVKENGEERVEEMFTSVVRNVKK